MNRQANGHGAGDEPDGSRLNSEHRDVWSPGSTRERLLLRPGEAAELLAISPRKLWELTNRGEIPSLRIGRSLRYWREALLRWVERQQRGRP
jgi:excisionase family DNA binding protein